MQVKPGQVPSFIKAKSPMGLRRIMLLNNTKHRKTFQYYSIQFVKGEWYAWFYLDIDVTLNEVENGNTK